MGLPVSVKAIFFFPFYSIMSVKVHENTIHLELHDLVKQECHKINDYCLKEIGTHKDGKYTTFWLHKDEKPETNKRYERRYYLSL
jgi:hypothetical protein